MVQRMLQWILHYGDAERHKEHEAEDKQSCEENKG